MSNKPNKPVVLIGLKSCGKSTIGHALADKLGCDYVDTDYLIELIYFEEHGVEENFRVIYKKVGSENFRALERQAIQRIVDMHETTVIATGGSTLLDDQNVELLKSHGHLIYLNASSKTLKQRWQQEPPGFIGVSQLDAELEAYYQPRHEKYQEIADEIVYVSKHSVEQIVADLIALSL